MKILVTLAVDAEFAPWRRLRDFHRIATSPVCVWGSRLEATDLRVVLTGMGPARAAQASGIVLADLPDTCISAGLAGALRSEHRPGEILAAQVASSAADNAVAQSDESLLQVALLCGAKPVAKFLTSGKLVRRAREKSRLGTAADAVDMESLSVLAEAARRQVPAVAIRAVSDAVSEDLPLDFSRVLDERGEVSVSRLFSQVARRPWSLPALARFARRSRRSATLLAGFLERFVRVLASRAAELDDVIEEVAAT